MKIAFLNITQGTVGRGAETFVREVSDRLRKNHQVTIFSDKKAPPARWPILWRLFIDPHGLTIAWFTLKNLSKVWNEKYDVVIPLNGGWQAALVRLTTWLYGGKMIVSGQSGKGWDDRNNLWSLPDVFVSTSSHLKTWAKRVNPFVEVEYIPNGVDITKFIPQGVPLRIRLRKPVVLCVGALTDEKRIDLAIKAVSKVKGASLLVVGDGPLKEKLVSVGKNYLGDRFLAKRIEFERMPGAYRAADVFTLPSPSYRSFEIAIVEAMASGLSVVVNSDPIRQEIVGDAGLLVDPKDTDSYAKAIEKALKMKWGNKPRGQAEKFDWDKIAKKYEELFQSLYQ